MFNEKTKTTANTELVTLNETEGIIMTTSRIVAKTYDKRHSHVIRDIKKLIGDIASLESQEELPTQPKFELSEYQDDSGRLNKMYLMDRNAWTLLVMGYTGPNATRFKLRYIAAFDAMETELKRIADDKLNSAQEIIRGLEYHQQALETNLKALFTLTEASKHVGIPVRNMNKALRDRGYFFKHEYNNSEPLELKWTQCQDRF